MNTMTKRRRNMDMASVQARVNSISPYYVRLASWKQEGNIIKAIPRYPISEAAFKAFKKVVKQLGGKFVSWRGNSWFELVLPVEDSARSGRSNSSQGPELEVLPCEPFGSVHRRMEAQINVLCRAGQEVTKERVKHKPRHLKEANKE